MNMSLFTIDQKKCKHDGMCAKECPSQIIVLADKDTFPTLMENGEESCINCGHCVAVCPHGAFTLNTMPLAECPSIQYNLLPAADQIRQLLMSRRSIRFYKNRVVAHDLLEELIDTARYAPTGSNKQQVQWTVFENPTEVNHLASMVIDWARLMLPLMPDESMVKKMERRIAAWDKGTDSILRGAPHLIAVHSPADLPFAEADCVIALSYLELYAYAKGLGTCWAGYLTAAANFHEPLAQALGLPQGHKCFGAMMLGYPQYKYTRIPKRNAPVVTWRP
jgi:nitroreductase/NAD-dependent dihydropyrimidine dehydrogenase PreA subunit